MAQQRIGSLFFEISADMKNIQGQLRTLEGNFQTSLTKISGIARGTLGALGLGIGAGSLIAFSKGVIDMAGHLTDLADQTGISAQTLSGMKSTLDEAGTSVDAFAKAIFAAQRNLGQITSESDQAARAAKRLGLDLNELRNASTEKFLDLVAGALGRVENVMERNSLGAALMGRQFQELAPALGQIAGRLDQLRAQGIREEDLRKLDEFGDLWTRLGNDLQIIAAGPLADIVRGIERLFGLSARGQLLDSLIRIEDEINRIDSMLERRKSLREKGFGFFTAPESQDAEALEQRRKLLEEQRRIDEQLNKLNAGAARPTPAPFKGLPTTKADTGGESFIASLRKQADALRVNIVELESGADAAKLYGLGLQFAEFKARLLAEKKPVPPGIEKEFNAIATEIGDLSKQLAAAKFAADRFNEVASMHDLDRSEWLNFESDVQEKIIKPLQEAKQAWDDMRAAEIGAAFDQDSAEFLNAAEGVAQELARQGREAVAVWSSVADGLETSFERSFEAVLTSTEDFGDRMSHFARNIGLSIAFELQKAFVVNPLLDALFGKRDQGGNRAGGFIGAAAGFIGGLLGFDEGGIVPGARGQPRLVLAHGGETILPTHQPASFSNLGVSSGGITIVNHNQIDARGAERGVHRDIERAIRASENRAVERAKVAIHDDRRRSNNSAKVF